MFWDEVTKKFRQACVASGGKFSHEKHREREWEGEYLICEFDDNDVKTGLMIATMSSGWYSENVIATFSGVLSDGEAEVTNSVLLRHRSIDYIEMAEEEGAGFCVIAQVGRERVRFCAARGITAVVDEEIWSSYSET